MSLFRTVVYRIMWRPEQTAPCRFSTRTALIRLKRELFGRWRTGRALLEYPGIAKKVLVSVAGHWPELARVVGGDGGRL